MTWALAILAVAVTLAGVYARRLLPNLERREAERQDFFRAAHALAARADTPDSVLAVVRFLAEKLGDGWAPYKIVFFLAHGDARRTASSPTPLARQLKADLERAPAEVRDLFGEAAAAALLAISRNSLLIGWLFRRLALYRVTKRDGDHHDGTEDANILAAGWASAA